MGEKADKEWIEEALVDQLVDKERKEQHERTLDGQVLGVQGVVLSLVGK